MTKGRAEEQGWTEDAQRMFSESAYNEQVLNSTEFFRLRWNLSVFLRVEFFENNPTSEFFSFYYSNRAKKPNEDEFYSL